MVDNAQIVEEISPACRHFNECGGCSLQHLSDEKYRDYKKSLLTEAIVQAGFDKNLVEDLYFIGAASRRRTILHVKPTKKGIELGYYKRGSRHIVDLQECPILETELEQLALAFKPLITSLNCARAVKELHLLSSDSGIEVQVHATTGVDGADRGKLEKFADVQSIARLIWKSRLDAENIVYQYPAQLDFGDVQVDLPKGAFLQATRAGQKAITQLVIDALKECNSVMDLYCGCGTYSFPLAQDGKSVLGYEGANEMVQAVNKACYRYEISNLKAQRRDLYKKPINADEISKFDGVVINPPRNGALPQIEQIAKSGIKNIVLVSCNPQTLQRDAKLLKESGYILEKAVPIDQFYWTTHLESVLIFRK